MGEVKIPSAWKIPKPKRPSETEVWIPPKRQPDKRIEEQPQIEIPPPLPPEERTEPDNQEERGVIKIGQDGSVEKI